MDIELTKNTVLEVFEDVAELVPFPVAWKFGPADQYGVVGTLYVDGRDFDLGVSPNVEPSNVNVAHELNIGVGHVASNLLDDIDVADMWASWSVTHTSWDEARGVHGFSDAVDSVAEHVTGMVESDIEAYANLLTIMYALKQLAEQYRTA